MHIIADVFAVRMSNRSIQSEAFARAGIQFAFVGVETRPAGDILAHDLGNGWLVGRSNVEVSDGKIFISGLAKMQFEAKFISSFTDLTK
jgi:hypothetical protein